VSHPRARGLLVVLVGALLAGGAAGALAQEVGRNLAGSIQLDYLAVPTEDIARKQALDGATVEVSLKLAVDFSPNLSANVKICYACHGFEVGMAFFDARVADELNFRVGRFTPSFGEFPLRHDPANHRTSDKPLPYDMGRMLRLREWNMSVLPAPWVDNGIEISGTHFFGVLSQVDYAVYAIMGPKGAADAVDFDFIQSRSPSAYYVDNNSRPTLGARLAATIGLGSATTLSLGASGMAGAYDPDNELTFVLLGADLVLRLDRVFLRAEYLIRRTEISLGDDPASRFRYGPGPDGEYDDFTTKEGWVAELEVPVGPFDLVGRWDGLRRRGNVLASSPLRSESIVMRSTAALSYRLHGALRLKLSGELYDFSDFDDELAVHVGVAAPF
jgi:hypothetical protein